MDRYKSAKLASILGIIGNIFLLVIKSIIGLITHSQSMISDALNSAGDIVSSVMTFIGNKVSSKEADDDHNLGHGKAEYIFSMLISILMIFMSISVFISSIKSLFFDYNYNYSEFLLLVCIITITLKFILYIITSRIAKKYNNLLVSANAKDHINDCLLTSLNLIAQIFGKFGITYVDGLVGSMVAIWIFIVAVKLFKESYDVLMDKGMNDDLKQEVIKIINKHPEIKKINHFNSTPIGYQYQISLTIFVDGSLSTFESHEIANTLEKEISALDEIYLTVIHVNPINASKRKNKR